MLECLKPVYKSLGGASASVGVFQGVFSPLQGGVWNVLLFFGVKLPDFSPLVGLKGEWTTIFTIWRVFTKGGSAWVHLDFMASSLFPCMMLINWLFAFLPQNKKWGCFHCSHILRTPEKCVSRKTPSQSICFVPHSSHGLILTSKLALHNFRIHHFQMRLF